MTLSTEEIDRERGVIIEEWRFRRSAQQRMLDEQYPVLFADSRYANRLPIGDVDLIATFPPDAARRFYENVGKGLRGRSDGVPEVRRGVEGDRDHRGSRRTGANPPASNQDRAVSARIRSRSAQLAAVTAVKGWERRSVLSSREILVLDWRFAVAPRDRFSYHSVNQQTASRPSRQTLTRFLVRHNILNRLFRRTACFDLSAARTRTRHSVESIVVV